MRWLSVSQCGASGNSLGTWNESVGNSKMSQIPRFSTVQQSDESRFDSLMGAKLTDIPQTKAFANRKSQIKSKDDEDGG